MKINKIPRYLFRVYHIPTLSNYLFAIAGFFSGVTPCVRPVTHWKLKFPSKDTVIPSSDFMAITTHFNRMRTKMRMPDDVSEINKFVSVSTSGWFPSVMRLKLAQPELLEMFGNGLSCDLVLEGPNSWIALHIFIFIYFFKLFYFLDLPFYFYHHYCLYEFSHRKSYWVRASNTPRFPVHCFICSSSHPLEVDAVSPVSLVVIVCLVWFGFLFAWLVGSFWFFVCFLNFSFIHMCIQCLGHFSPLPLTPSFTPPLLPLIPRCPAETILPLSLILLKREYKQ
jgi:hypothetical protein